MAANLSMLGEEEEEQVSEQQTKYSSQAHLLSPGKSTRLRHRHQTTGTVVPAKERWEGTAWQVGGAEDSALQVQASYSTHSHQGVL